MWGLASVNDFTPELVPYLVEGALELDSKVDEACNTGYSVESHGKDDRGRRRVQGLTPTCLPVAMSQRI